MNGEPIPQANYPKRPKQESFLIDCKAIPGTSGSPVFIGPLQFAGAGMVNLLLGVVWGYSTRKNKVKHKAKDDTQEMDTLHFNENTGLMLVIPAWKLTKFLNRSDLLNTRRRIEQEAIDGAKNTSY
jgi:hypothetical protein